MIVIPRSTIAAGSSVQHNIGQAMQHIRVDAFVYALAAGKAQLTVRGSDKAEIQLDLVLRKEISRILVPATGISDVAPIPFVIHGKGLIEGGRLQQTTPGSGMRAWLIDGAGRITYLNITASNPESNLSEYLIEPMPILPGNYVIATDGCTDGEMQIQDIMTALAACGELNTAGPILYLDNNTPFDIEYDIRRDYIKPYQLCQTV